MKAIQKLYRCTHGTTYLRILKKKKKKKPLGNLGNIPSFLISVLSIANFESSDYKNSEEKFRVFELALFKENLKILNVVSYVKSVKKRFIKQIFWRK